MNVVRNLRVCWRFLDGLESLSFPSPLSEDSDFLLSGEESRASEPSIELFSFGESARVFWQMVGSSGISAGECCIATGMT